MDKTVPFWPVAILAVVAVNASAQTQTGTPAPQPATPRGTQFLNLGEGERYWYYEGAIRNVAHLVSTHDKAKGECVSQWFGGNREDRAAKRKLIEETLAKNSDQAETTIILSLLTQACGNLLPASR